MKLDEVKSALAKQGIAVKTSSPDQLATIITSDLTRWKKVVIEAKISAD